LEFRIRNLEFVHMCRLPGCDTGDGWVAVRILTS
jgi:hypothetical protein